MKHLISNITKGVIIVLCLFFLGCSSAMVRTPEYDLTAFDERATYLFDITEDSYRSAVSLFSIPQVAQANIHLPSCDNILYVRLIEMNKLNIDRHLIRGIEYLFNKRDKTLKVNFDLPVVYLLDGEAYFVLDILKAQKKEGGIYGEKIKKEIVFFWKPSKVIDDSKGLKILKYVDPMADKYPLKNSLKKIMQEEMVRTNLERFDGDYRLQLEDFIGW